MAGHANRWSFAAEAREVFEALEPARLDSPLDVREGALRAAEARLDALEEKLAALLVPILERAGASAAAAFQRKATDHLTAAALRQADLDAERRELVTPGPAGGLAVGLRLRPTVLTAAAGPDGVTSASTMVAVKPRPDEALRIAQLDGSPAEYLHVTLAYLGETEGDLEAVVEALRPVAASHAPLSGVVGGVGIFAPSPEGVGPSILLPDVPGLVELRVAVTEALQRAGIGYGRDHGFEAHITVTYYGDGEPGFEPPLPMLEPLHFDELYVVRGDVEVIPLPLVGPPPLTAAADPFLADLVEAFTRPLEDPGRPADRLWFGPLRAAADPPGWGAPAGDEILDVASLVQTLRARTDPVRRAFLEAGMTPTLEKAGISFDVTNPFTAKVLAQAGSQVTNIADTTRLNVMRTIKESYEQGLSIPETAKAIQAGMSDAAPVRARMIARTELAGAANGGSLAATQIVASATGDSYVKKWMTAPGAPHPRHELYPDLDGQTQALDAYFDVGGSQLQFPGDPDGDPGETINCRCALSYVAADEASTEPASTDEQVDPVDLPDSAKAAAETFMRGVAETELQGGKVPDDAALAEGAKNWAKHLRKDADFSEESLAKVRAADAYNRESAVLRAQIAEHGRDVAVVVKDSVAPASPLSPGRDLAAAKRLTGNRVTVLRREALDEARTGPIRPGDAGSISNGGLEAVLRHEYGHQLEEALTPEARAAFRSSLPEQDVVRDELTRYAAGGLDVGNAQEAFCELFAVVSDPAYDPAAWPTWVRELGARYFGAPASAAEEDAPAIAARMVARAAELEPQTTAELSTVAGQAGGRMAGLDFAVKTQASLERKIAADMADAVKAGEHPSVAEVAGTINDTLRYTMTFPEAGYTKGVKDAVAKLAQAGYRTVKIKNYWGNADYQGINAVFEKDGHRLELQFHTPRTFELKTELHEQYEAFRTSSDPVERVRLWNEMAAEQAKNAVPPNAFSIGTRVTHEAPPGIVVVPPSLGG